MRNGLKIITPVLAAGAAAVAISAAPIAQADPTPAQPAGIATGPTASADHVFQVAGHGGGGRGGGGRGGGFQGGGRGGWHGDRGQGGWGGWWPWGWHR
jgi:hypothetical protein